MLSRSFVCRVRATRPNMDATLGGSLRLRRSRAQINGTEPHMTTCGTVSLTLRTGSTIILGSRTVRFDRMISEAHWVGRSMFHIYITERTKHSFSFRMKDCASLHLSQQRSILCPTLICAQLHLRPCNKR